MAVLESKGFCRYRFEMDNESFQFPARRLTGSRWTGKKHQMAFEGESRRLRWVCELACCDKSIIAMGGDLYARSGGPIFLR
eukprot:CAMPEP_0171683056 /NCGR_PEP_ID=MMETSP0991-20121206/890_1 /TAXON_ID=483369 /ORGANISM="non described non described, Strain CCMP2098" /LENGTH=80 /DNA_ID=CAMNT_0012270369 /DNA_START=255 /DNA_END=497 /DNA_ORIENTATION=-